MPNRLSEIVVTALPGDPTRGRLVAGEIDTPCALGRSGITHNKREGDGGTPAGSFRLMEVYYRPDRLAKPATLLPIEAITPMSGWCDDPADPNYNRFVRLPYTADHEELWRSDHLYDVLVVLDYNLQRPVPGLGSAIFLHIASRDFAPTAGCVAIAAEVMVRLLKSIGLETQLVIA